MGVRRIAVNFVLKRLVNLLCKIDSREFVDALAKYQPMILAINHINFLEIPLLVSHGYPHYIAGLAKSETWNNPVFSFIFNTYKAIPIDRNSSFTGAFQKVRKAIDDNYFVIFAPEGTRSKNGVLSQGKAGLIYLAFEAGIPIMPVVHFGGQNIWKNMRRFRRTKLKIKTGKPFTIRFEHRPCKEERKIIMDEIMGQIAKLLPPEMRGIYADHAEHECKYLEFIPPLKS